MKPYKPAFIIFLDLIYAITFFFWSFMYYWFQLQMSQPLLDLLSFIPVPILIFQLIYFLKFLINVFYLLIFFDAEALNRSKSTGSLFRFRILFDMATLFLVVYGAKLFFTEKENDRMGKVWWYILGSRLIMELIIYYLCVVPAYRRAVY